jgi:hypothetical protein
MSREPPGASSFDELARGLASGSISRAKALRLMGAALVGGTLASVGIGEAAAAPPGCKRNGKKCNRGEQCCSGNCQSGTCVASCIPPDAIVGCGTPTIDCPGGCVCSPEVSGAIDICRGPSVTDVPCTTSCDCPTGLFCLTGGLCVRPC